MTHARKWRRTGLSMLCAAGMAGSMTVAAPLADAAPSPADCTADSTVQIFNFNDFHGRIGQAAKLFTPVAQARTQLGADKVLLLSDGDNIGGSTFESGSLEDNPTLDILKAAKVEASSVGNHEFDKGWSDLTGHVIQRIDGAFPYLGANVYLKGTTTVASPLQASTIIKKDGVRIGVVGAVTKDLPSLVSPAGISNLTIGDPVAAVNAEAKRLKSSGQVDVVVAEIHDGAAVGGTTDPSTVTGNFADIWSGTSTDVDVMFNGHTHQTYSWTTKNGAPLLQAESYGTKLAKVELGWSSSARKLCSAKGEVIPAATDADSSDPTIAEISKIYADAKAQSEVVGAQVIGTSTAPITTPSNATDSTFGANVRDRESTMTNMVAQMFKDVLGKDDPSFIGIQNPGGTRASLLNSDITYKDAALVLPFANTLMTTKISGAQFKKVLEEQWQRDAKGAVPSRPYLQLGLSSNVTYTYDESRPEGDRITGIWVNGKPIDPKGTYTVGSGSFLITGGDNFRTLAEGSKPVDTGKIDLDAWVSWIKDQKTLTPSYAKQAVSLTSTVSSKSSTTPSFTLGQPAKDGVAPDTVDFTSKGAPANSKVVATIEQGSVKVSVGEAAVKAGVGTVSFTIPDCKGLKNGSAVVTFTFPDSKTVVRYNAEISGLTGASCTPTPGKPSPSKPGTPTPGKPGMPKPGLPKTGN